MDSIINKALSEVIVSGKDINNLNVIATEDWYDNNQGFYSLAYVLDGGEVIVKRYADAHDNLSHDDIKVNASEEDILKGAEIYSIQEAKHALAKNKLVGSIVVLSRSRKAPNNVPLSVIDLKERTWNQRGYFNPEEILVQNGEDQVWVAKSCIKEVLKTKLPWWAL